MNELNEYWRISLEEIFDEYDLEHNEKLFKDIAFIAEMESEACGHHFIPNPRDTEVEELKAKIKTLEEAHRVQIDGIRDGVAQRRGVSASDVTIDKDGMVTYYIR